MPEELTLAQEKRQELVDDAIDTMLATIAPNGEWQWDIEKAGDIRDYIYQVVFKPAGVSEMEFYPYRTGGK
jgi:hypothetical protein